MSQSSVIAAFLLIGFLVFITARGQLPAYLSVLGISTAVQSGSSASGTGKLADLESFGGI